MLLAVIMVCSMAACGGGSSSSTAGSSAPAETQAAAPTQDQAQTPAEAGSAEEGSNAETAAAPAGTYGEDVPISDIVKDMELTELPLSDGSTTFDDWMDANLDYSRALPSTEMLNMEEKAEYASIYSDVETFLKEAIAKYIIGDYSFDSYDTDFVGKLESMNIERCVELYQQAYDRYMENHAA